MATEVEDKPTLPSVVQQHLGQFLRDRFREMVEEPIPVRFEELLRALAEAGPPNVDDPAFKDGLVAAIPSLRSFATSLTRNATKADDLVQDTLVRAWQHRARFEPGTNLGAWLFTILRNLFYSSHRKAGREVEDVDGSHAASLATLPAQEDRVELTAMREAIAKLPPEQGRALILVAAEGMSYEQVARISGVAVGTVKSRVNRARARLAETMGVDKAELGADPVMRATLVN